MCMDYNLLILKNHYIKISMEIANIIEIDVMELII